MKKGAKPPEIRKQELIDVSLELFLKKGYANVSVKDILDEVKGQRGMFYHYFQNKQDIYEAVLDQFTRKVVQGHLLLLQNNSLTIQEKMDGMFARLQQYAHTYMQKLYTPDHMADILFITINILRELATPLAELFVQAIDNGEFLSTEVINKDNAYEVALFLINGCNSLFREQYVKDTQEISVEQASIFVRYFLGI